MQAGLLQTPSYKSENLFSVHYLENYLKQHPICQEQDFKKSLNSAFDKIQKLYQQLKKSHPEKLNEAPLREDFINKVLIELGFVYDVETPILDAFGVYGQPDYSVFSTEDEKILARTNKERDRFSFFNNAIGLVEAKEWNDDLDRAKTKEGKGNPTLQISNYLLNTKVKWGILTNGRVWRIFYRETCSRLDSYFEMNLADILEQKNILGFKWFYLFFRKDAFVPKEGRCFLDEVYDESVKRSKVLEKNIKGNVYEALRLLAKGFLEHPDNNLKIENLKEIHDNCLILLYRLLFILFAEASRRNLLPIENPVYSEISLEKIKNEIAKRDYSVLLPTSETYWTHLKNLFAIINLGSENRRIPKDKLYIPPYNGGLFDTMKHTFLEKYKVGDRYLAEAIDLLARSRGDNGAGRSFIDYSSLEIRQLGSIYEGLLEYKLKIAEVAMVGVSDKKSEKWIPQSEYKGKKPLDQIDKDRKVNSGDLYLITDKGERKSTGSYYTPDYIVEYIVRNTIGPVVEEKWREAEVKDTSFTNTTLSIKVLDPAMGSGHFLVGSLDFLASKLLEAIEKDNLKGRTVQEHQTTKEWARREVLAHCIYGVDLNPLAVELAKVSLWLTTISKDKPLSFLDHRLKQGNSLIGAGLTDLPWYHEGERDSIAQKDQKPIISPVIIDKVLSKISEIERTSDDTLPDIKKKEAIFEEFKKIPEYQKLKQIADLNTSFYFGNKIEKTEYKIPSSYYYDLIGSLYGDEREWQKRTSYDWFKEGMKISQQNNFFHWELEFPEISFEKGSLKENPGWDAVIGNPPYVRQESLGQEFKQYAKKKFESYFGIADLYVYFIEKSHQLLQKAGYFGFICSNKFMKANYGKKIREYLKNRTTILSITDFGELPVFEDASTFPAIIITKKESTDSQNFPYTAIKNLNFLSLDDEVSKNGVLQDTKSLKGNNWTFSTKGGHIILEKMRLNSIPLSEYVNNQFYRGLLTGYNQAFVIDRILMEQLLAQDFKNKEFIKPFVIGDDIRKYQIKFDNRYVILFRKGWTNSHSSGTPNKWEWFKNNYPSFASHLEKYSDEAEKRYDKGDYWWELRACDYYELFEKPKIVYPEIAKESRFAYDTDGYFINNKGFLIPTNDLYLLAILNSKAIWFVLKNICSVIGDQEKGGRLELRSVFLKDLPIHQISFTTPADRRFAMMNEAKELYNSFIQTNDWQSLMAFVDARLAATPEEPDVVHDLLAFLAEQMIEMNKAKNQEILSFISWLEQEIGGRIDILTNKTAIDEYYLRPVEEIIAILKKNKNRMTVDPSRRTFKEKIEPEIAVSKAKLQPLITRIKSTDDLIDQFVFKLYGLSDEEIEIVKKRAR